jgi:hypothetical protein
VGEMSLAARPAGPSFRTIGELAERCGSYCWIEKRLFELTGSWASAPASGDPELRVFFAEMSTRHALLAAQWADRLPVRADVDPAALVVPPTGRAVEVLDLLAAEPDLRVRLSGLVEQFLPSLLGTYVGHRADASPVAEAPVRAVLELAGHAVEQEMRRGRALVRRTSGSSGDEREVAALAGRLQPLVGGVTGVFPGAWAS